MIEAFQFGLPTITFSDLDAIQDIYNEKAMLILKERSDKVLAEGISSMLKISWDEILLNNILRNLHCKKWQSSI